MVLNLKKVPVIDTGAPLAQTVHHCCIQVNDPITVTILTYANRR